MNLFLTPEVLLTAWIAVLLLVICFKDSACAGCVGKLAIIGTAVILLSTWVIPAYVPDAWGALYGIDPVAIFFKRFFLATAIVVLWMSRDYISQVENSRQEFFIIPLITLLGLLLLASATDFIMLFVALELVTISFYILVAFQRRENVSLEAGAKYLVVGALATGFLIFGIAFLIGATGKTNFTEIAEVLASHHANLAIVFALILIGVGVGFKVAAVPFHSWVPDVYQGAPTPVSAYLAVASKAAGFLILLRVFYFGVFAVPQYTEVISTFFAILAGGSVILGSFAALPQSNLKRLLGYSSIANAGFLLMGLSALSERGIAAVMVYLVVYFLSTLLAFFCISILRSQLGGEDLRYYAGLSQRSPFFALILTLAFVSLAGLPPLVGFVGKLSIFAAVWQSEQYVLLALGIAGAVAGIYYYLRIVRSMYWLDPVETTEIKVSLPSKLLAGVFGAAIIILGIWQAPLACVSASTLKPLACQEQSASCPMSTSSCSAGSEGVTPQKSSCPSAGAVSQPPASTCH